MSLHGSLVVSLLCMYSFGEFWKPDVMESISCLGADVSLLCQGERNPPWLCERNCIVECGVVSISYVLRKRS